MIEGAMGLVATPYMVSLAMAAARKDSKVPLGWLQG